MEKSTHRYCLSKCVDSEHIDSATGTAAQYAIPNVLSGRHCKYMMTFAKSKKQV